MTSRFVFAFLCCGLGVVIPVNGIISIVWLVALDFSTDTGVMTAESPGYLPQGTVGNLQMADDIPLLFCKMGLGHGGLLSGVSWSRFSHYQKIPSCPAVTPRALAI
jgi:hypothetical protein